MLAVNLIAPLGKTETFQKSKIKTAIWPSNFGHYGLFLQFSGANGQMAEDVPPIYIYISGIDPAGKFWGCKL